MKSPEILWYPLSQNRDMRHPVWCELNHGLPLWRRLHGRMDGWCCRLDWRRRKGMAFAHGSDLVQNHWRQRLVVRVALYAGDGFHHLDAGIVALAKERVVLIERVVGLLS